MSETALHSLRQALVAGNRDQARAAAKALLEAGVDRERIVVDGVEQAMGQLDEKCTLEQFNLLEIMLCGRAVMEVMKLLFPEGRRPDTGLATVVLGSLEGDVHDLGKNIFGIVLSASGYRVVDCGKDCPLERLVEAVESEGAAALGLSGLIPTIVPSVRLARTRLAERGLDHVRIVAGGATLRQASAENLKVDFVADSAFDGLHYLNRTLGKTS